MAHNRSILCRRCVRPCGERVESGTSYPMHLLPNAASFQTVLEHGAFLANQGANAIISVSRDTTLSTRKLRNIPGWLSHPEIRLLALWGPLGTARLCAIQPPGSS